MIFWITAGAALALDQLTKYMVREMMQVGESIRVLGDFFKITFVYNPGGAFSLFAKTSDAFRVPFFLGVAALCIILILYYRRKLAPGQTLALAALGLILGGALGNVIDRLTLGVITDFLEFGINRHYFPVFNIADSCITVGAAIIILSLGIKRREPDLVGSRLNRPVRPGGGN